MTAKWSVKTIEQIENMLNTNAAGGLTRKAARLRLKKGGENRTYDTESISFLSCAAHLLGDMSSYLLIIAALVAAVFDHLSLAIVIIVTWALNVILAFFTYYKAESVFENSSYYSIPKTKLIREGKLYISDPRNVVRGDVILLREGDVAPCDLRLCSSKDLIALEYDENGSKNLRRKDADARIYDPECPPAAEVNMVFSGSVIVSGEGRAIAVDVGEDTYTFETVGLLPLECSSDINSVEKLGKYCSVWSIILLVLAVPITIIGAKQGIFESFMLSVALASSTMSEMIVAIGRIITACSVVNAAVIGDADGNKAILKNASCIDKMTGIDTVLFLDDAVFCAGETLVADILAKDEAILLTSAMIASNMGFAKTELDASIHIRNADDIALEDYSSVRGITRNTCSKAREFVERCAATRFNFDTVLVKEAEGFFAYIKGDAPAVLARCTHFRKDGVDLPMTAEIIDDAVSFINGMTAKKRRVYAYAIRTSQYNNLQRVAALQTELSYVGLVAFGDPVISDAASYVGALSKRGIEPVFAFETNNSELKELLSSFSALFRVYNTPDIVQKKKIFADLKKEGKKIGVVASKISDMTIMRDADVSFTCAPDDYSKKAKETVLYLTPAEKDYGTQAAKKEADVIVKRATEKKHGIASVLCAVDYSLAVRANLMNVVAYLLCTTVIRLILTIFGIFSENMLVNPQQILFCGLIVDFLAILMFAFNKPSDSSITQIGSKQTVKAYFGYASGGIFAAALIICVPYIISALGIPADKYELLTYSFTSLVLTQLVILFEMTARSKRMNVINFLSYAAVLLFASLILFVNEIGGLFGVALQDYRILLISFVPPILLFVTSRTVRFVYAKLNK